MTPDKPEAAPVDHLRFHRGHAHLAPTFGNDTFALKAEAFARFFGTPTFLGAQTVIVVLWVALNMSGITHFDVYPFILLNLFLSMLAAVQAPVIMMSQNRQDAKDRLRSELDYDVNRRAESEIQGLARKLNILGDKIGDIEDMLREERAKN